MHSSILAKIEEKIVDNNDKNRQNAAMLYPINGEKEQGVSSCDVHIPFYNWLDLWIKPLVVCFVFKRFLGKYPGEGTP